VCETGSSAVLESNTNTGRLDTPHNNHWPGRNHTKWRCPMCSARSATRPLTFKCVKCDASLCVDRNCFTDYHTKNNL